MERLSRWISSMKSTSPSCRWVRMAAMSALRSSAGPEVVTMFTLISRAMMLASVVLPSPGGPARSTWSSGSPREVAASMKICSCSRRTGCPTKAASDRGRRERSSSCSRGASSGSASLSSSSLVRLLDPRSPRRRRPVAQRPDRQRRPAPAGPGPPPAGRRRAAPAACSASEHAVAQLHQRRPGQRQRAVLRRQTAAGPAPAAEPGIAHLLPQLQDEPLGRLLADPRHRGEQGHVARRPGPASDRAARRQDSAARPAWARSCSPPGTAGTAPAPPRWRSRTAAGRPRARAGG